MSSPITAFAPISTALDRSIAANPDIRMGLEKPKTHYEQNILATHNLLEAMREQKVKKIVFTSTSTVYGDAKVSPVPETYGPLKPISVYGASKLASEALISDYSHTYGMKSIICRLANIVGPRSGHGVIHDFIKKLKQNPKALEILGDGTQTKSYLYIDDYVKGILCGTNHAKENVEVFNIGANDFINVKTIADLVAEKMGLRNVKYNFTGGVNGGRGWRGDIKTIRLSTEKLKSLGWQPRHSSLESASRAAEMLIERLHAKNSPLAINRSRWA